MKDEANMNVQERMKLSECRERIKELWSRYGFYLMLHAMADVIEYDTRMVEQTGRFPEEVGQKDTLVMALRKGADGTIE